MHAQSFLIILINNFQLHNNSKISQLIIEHRAYSKLCLKLNYYIRIKIVIVLILSIISSEVRAYCLLLKLKDFTNFIFRLIKIILFLKIEIHFVIFMEYSHISINTVIKVNLLFLPIFRYFYLYYTVLFHRTWAKIVKLCNLYSPIHV